MAQAVDYTKRRKGSKVGKLQIGVCPKCGRKGIMAPPFKQANGKWMFGTCKHKVKIVTLGGLQIVEVTDMCFISPPEEGKVQDAKDL